MDTSRDPKWHPIARSLINLTVAPYVLDRETFAAQFARRPNQQAYFGSYREPEGLTVTSFIESEPQRPDLGRAGNWMRFQTDAVLNTSAGQPQYQRVTAFLDDVNWQDADGVLHKVEGQTSTLRLNSDPPERPYRTELGARQSTPFDITVHYLWFGR